MRMVLVLVPEGLAIIAQRFNDRAERGCPQPQQPRFHERAGISATVDSLGAAAAGDSRAPHGRPSLRDLHFLIIEFPTLKRWAIIGHPSGMTSGKFSWHWTSFSSPRPREARAVLCRWRNIFRPGRGRCAGDARSLR